MEGERTRARTHVRSFTPTSMYSRFVRSPDISVSAAIYWRTRVWNSVIARRTEFSFPQAQGLTAGHPAWSGPAEARDPALSPDIQ